MDSEDRRFSHWVSCHERDSVHDPARFRSRTAAMAVAGYAAIWVTLALCALAIGFVLARWQSGDRVGYWGVMLSIGAASLMVSVLRALWTPFPSPEGLRVTRDEAPALFKMLDKVRKRTGGPKFHEVVIDGELNAAVVQRPRLGVLGWYRNSLVLGLPLLMLLDAKQLASVVAHEYGHLSGAHGKLSGWVYRTRRSWLRLAELQGGAQLGSWWANVALNLFLVAYFPRFNARAFVLSRQQEFEADKMAHRVAGQEPSVQALVSITLASRYLNDEFWPDVFSRSRKGGELRETPYRDMRVLLGQANAHPSADAWLKEAWKVLPGLVDTHPSLRQRLEFAKCAPCVPAAVGSGAAAILLGKSLDKVVAALDAQWQRSHAQRWAASSRWYAGQAKRLAELEERRANEDKPLTASETLERALCIQRLQDRQAALQAFRQANVAFPANEDIAYHLANLLAQTADDSAQAEAFELWTLVSESGSRHAVSAFEQAIAWLERADRHKDAQAWRQKLKDRLQKEDEAMEERQDFSGKQFYSVPGFTREQLQPCLDTLIRERAVGAAYLVRKQTRLFSQRDFCVLLVERSKAAKQPSSEHYWHDLLEKIELPCEFMVVDAAHPHWKTREQLSVLQDIKRVPNARIYGGSALGVR